MSRLKPRPTKLRCEMTGNVDIPVRLTSHSRPYKTESAGHPVPAECQALLGTNVIRQFFCLRVFLLSLQRFP